jgi:hypothetical protein
MQGEKTRKRILGVCLGALGGSAVNGVKESRRHFIFV